MESKQDHENYFKMSEPHASQDAADSALKLFYEELGELRKKHKIRDLLTTIYDSAISPDGETGQFMAVHHFGNSINQLPMAAYAFGQTQTEHDQRIKKLIAMK